MDLQYHKLLKFLLLLVFVAVGINAQSKEQEVIKDLFENQQYDRRIRPGNGPVEVTVNMYVRSVTRLENNELDVQLTYRQKWKDDRLSYKGDLKSVSLIDPEKLVWIPDTFFSNAKEANVHDVMTRNEFVRISPDGHVLQSARISLKLDCPMSLRNFPLDRQTCSIRLASYGYRVDEVEYIWEDKNPIQIGKELNLPAFTLEKFETSNSMGITNTGNYSALIADFTFKRAFNSYLIGLYIPCCMFVVLSWTSFWLCYRAVTARTTLLIVTIVSLAMVVMNARKDFPSAGHTMAVDVWTGICLTFIMAAHLEFMTAQYIDRRQRQHNSSVNTGDEEEQVPLKEEGETKKQGPNTEWVFKNIFTLYDSNSLSDKLDGISRIAFPVTFIIFMVVYSIAYCPSSA